MLHKMIDSSVVTFITLYLFFSFVREFNCEIDTVNNHLRLFSKPNG